ncbi:hypothetical protein D3C72_2523720 [compost metagenome]
MGVSLGVVSDLGSALRVLRGLDLGVDDLALFQVGGIGLPRRLRSSLSGRLRLLAGGFAGGLQPRLFRNQEGALGGV